MTQKFHSKTAFSSKKKQNNQIILAKSNLNSKNFGEKSIDKGIHSPVYEPTK